MEQPLENKAESCVRCGQSFECRAADIAHCQCRQVKLSAAALEVIGRRYEGCLCVDCLVAISREFSDSTK